MRKFQIFRKICLKVNLFFTLPLQLSLFLFPLILVPSPVIPMIKIHYYSIVTLSFWIFTFLSSFIFRRAHCGYTCGISSLFILKDQIKNNNKKRKNESPVASSSLSFEMPLYTSWIIKAVYFALPFILMIYYIRGLLSSHSIPLVIVTLFFPIGALLSFSIGKSRSQHYLCPLAPFLNTGTRLGQIFFQLDIKSDEKRCVQCGKCSFVCLLDNQIPQQLTAGNFDERECMNCGECATVCPTGVLEYTFFTKSKFRKS